MNRGRRAAILCVAAIATHGCLLFTDISGLDADDAVSPDGGDSSATEASTTDASSDAPNADGGGDDRDGAASTGCATSDAAFCEDFDDGGLAPRWTFLETSGGGITVETSTAVSRSPSTSFHSAVDRAVINPPANDCEYGRIYRDLAGLGARNRTVVAFDAWLGSPNGPPITGYVLVGHVVTSKKCNFIISLEDQGCGVIFQYSRDGGAASDDLGGELLKPIGKAWAHVELDLSFDPAVPKWSLSVNGARCGGVEKVMPVECQSAQTISVNPGIYCENKGTGVAEVFIDNVEVR